MSEQQHEKVSQAGDRGLLRSHKAGKVTKLAVACSIEGVYKEVAEPPMRANA